MFIKTYLRRKKNGYKMWQFHTINTAFLSCSENMWMQKKKKGQLGLMTNLTTLVTFINCQTRAESSATNTSSWEWQQQYALSKQVWLQPKRVECYLHRIEGSLHPIQSKLLVISNYCREKAKVGKGSIQYSTTYNCKIGSIIFIIYIPQFSYCNTRKKRRG